MDNSRRTVEIVAWIGAGICVLVWICVLVSLFFWATAEGATDIEQKHEEVLYPVVLVRTTSGSGSGTVVWSGTENGSEYQTFILTADHVIENACEVKTVWEPFLARDVKKEVRSTVWAEFYVYRNLSRAIGTTVIESDIVARDPKKDVALLKLRSTTLVKNVSPLWPKSEIEKLQLFQPVYAVGAQLGHPPLATGGEIQNMDIEIEGEKYILITAPIIYGSSGGTALALNPERNHWEVIGIPARGSLVGYGQMVTHLGKCVSLANIYAFLEANCYEFIYDSSTTPSACEKTRKEKAEAEKKALPKETR